ncbi:MAG: selenocysteine-specific translation elongation factor [Verrucomicrobia bacterium]|nr:selenocysteine-specific translation elongation factor [Verrucomicrobiota bacterium]OQC66204.1 MAG: Selenocysteine-specific elongation factor [Verrucomicrobia bacterium ADurb.Bin006]MDI9382444.1 selenocysteine-specific translation elongation factor [Verrucomicrobiota bacterium]NMD19502.1 selenocysteine-specific translation elongation factor [Verrucomicrobiota bacterium]HOA61712.1 selenocysteine-specific translation elongation factor [Verrucomicrobiota bacterium]
MRHVILATAGHVDHGKSALVKALTSTDPDRLPEEKARGITIDLGFAHMDLSAPDEPLPGLSVGIVDVPGHEDFVKTMVAGVGSIDLALLVVAADDGWMPQTEEHLQILDYLGVTRAVVALTKSDLVGNNEFEAAAAVREQLRHSPFAQAPLVPTSVVTGRGLDELKTALARALAHTEAQPDLGKPRLPVDRVFTLRGIGTVVTGTLTGGRLTRGQAAVLQPGGVPCRIRSLQNHRTEIETGEPGMRTAVNLADVEPRSDAHPEGVGRGDVLTLSALGGPSATADVWIQRSSRLAAGASPAARPLKDRTRVRIHFGSANAAATLFFQGGRDLLAGQSVLAQARFESPVFMMLGDRFIVRDWSEQVTLAGGLVLDPDGDRKRWQAKPRVALLEARASAPADIGVWLATQLERDRLVRRDALLKKARCSDVEVAAALGRLAQDGAVILFDELAVHASWWADLKRRAAERINLEHRARPERLGLALSELAAALEDDVSLPGAFEVLVADLAEGEFRQVGTVIQRRTHRPDLPQRLKAAGAFVRQALAEKPLEPPSRKHLASDQPLQQALQFLLDTGQAVEISADIVLSAEGYADALARIKAHLQRTGAATVSDLRQALGSSRRIMVPLLEKLDREGVTLRQGDLRRLGPRV